MDANLIPGNKQTDVALPQPQMQAVMDLNTCINAWLHAKFGRSQSQKTATAYKETLVDFRSGLQKIGSDLDATPSMLAPLAQAWAAQPKKKSRVTANTYNQRLAILSSFYTYAMKHEVLTSNPIERVERRVVIKEHTAHALKPEVVREALKTIDRQTPVGKRDSALLQVALATGRRVSELAGMRYGHLTWTGDTVIVRWPRCKGGKSMTDLLPAKTTAALLSYLNAIYGPNLVGLAASTPIWVSFSDRSKGKAIGVRTLQRISDQYLGTSKFHTTRHTWSVTMAKKKASLQEIGKGLGHSNLKTTSDYLEEQLGYENALAPALEEAFGFE